MERSSRPQGPSEAGWTAAEATHSWEFVLPSVLPQQKYIFPFML